MLFQALLSQLIGSYVYGSSGPAHIATALGGTPCPVGERRLLLCQGPVNPGQPVLVKTVVQTGSMIGRVDSQWHRTGLAGGGSQDPGVSDLGEVAYSPETLSIV